MKFAGDRLHLDGFNLVAFEHVERHLDAGIATFPQPRIKISLSDKRLTTEADNDVTGQQSCIFSGPFRSDAGDDDLALDFLRSNAQPRPRLGGSPAIGDEITEHGFQRINRHKHVAGHATLADRITHRQRTDAE